MTKASQLAALLNLPILAFLGLVVWNDVRANAKAITENSKELATIRDVPELRNSITDLNVAVAILVDQASKGPRYTLQQANDRMHYEDKMFESLQDTDKAIYQKLEQIFERTFQNHQQ